ncbi:MAG: carbohydrate kinase family protein [Candidatus Pacebacteria bacterium]|nr:carbohydrate kinase family protein [Candidatus Paceibacterota bacterium]
MNNEFDFIAIGDIVIDAFIKINNAKVRNEKGSPELCISFANKVPYEWLEVVSAVGNSPNASVSASRLGLKSALVTNIGDDDHGRNCQRVLEKENVATNFVKIHPNDNTNYHFVLLYEADRTILVKHTEFDYKLPNIGTPKWIYFSSVAKNSLSYHKEIAKYLKNNPEVKLAFQPGTFQMELGYEKLKEIYEQSEVFFCNVQEAKRILNPIKPEILNKIIGKNKKETVIELLKEMRNLGPKIVAITDGPEGAYTYDGKKILYTPMYPDIQKPLDRTGAGDAFASAFTSALAIGKNIEEALQWGPINSMSVVQFVGAQKGLLTQAKLKEYLEKAPEHYKVTEL